MTDQEREIKRIISCIRSCRNAGTDITITIGKNRSHFILNALEELWQYREIGTVEECREARKKQRAKRPVKTPDCGECTKEKCGTDCISYSYGRTFICPACHKNTVYNSENDTYYNACINCRQAIDWSHEILWTGRRPYTMGREV